jgi:hypothetical protein
MDSSTHPVIIAYTGPVINRSEDTISRDLPEIPELAAGEIMVTSRPGAWLKADAAGQISIHVDGASIVCAVGGEITMSSPVPITRMIGKTKIIEGVHNFTIDAAGESTVELIYSLSVDDKLVHGVTPEGKIVDGKGI